MLIILYFLLFLFFIFIGTPIGFAMILASLVYAFYNHINIIMIALRFSDPMGSFTLLAVPAFVFVGVFLTETGFTDRIFKFAEDLVGHVPGGLGHANVLASMIFAGMSGDSTADAGGLGAIEVVTMKKAGYDENFATAITAASSGIGPIIPPSINFVIYGFLAEVSVARLFIAGFIPGVIMGLSLMALIYIRVKSGKIRAPILKKASFQDLKKSFKEALPALFAPILLIGGILSGIFTPTEAGCICVFYSIVLSLIYKTFSFKKLTISLERGLRITAISMLLISGGCIFNWFLITGGLLDKIVNLFVIIKNPYLVLLVFNLIILFMGCFMSITATIVLMTPILVSISGIFGFNLVHMGVVLVLNLMIGINTPPYAPALFVTCEVAGTSFEKSLKELLPFLIPLIVTLAMITYIPGLTMFLPNLLFK